MNHDKKHIQQLVDVLAAFDVLKRKRNALVTALSSYDNANTMTLAIEAADMMAVQAFIDGHQAGKVDADKFKGEATLTVLNAVVDLGLYKPSGITFGSSSAEGPTEFPAGETDMPASLQAPPPPPPRRSLAKGARGVTLPSSGARQH
jgi:hypothetical protein